MVIWFASCCSGYPGYKLVFCERQSTREMLYVIKLTPSLICNKSWGKNDCDRWVIHILRQGLEGGQAA